MSKVVFEGKTESGEDLVIRYIERDDGRAVLRYINELSFERTFVRMQGEQLSLEEEQKYVDGQVNRINNKESAHLLAFVSGKLVGVSSIDMRDKVEKHVGLFGISVAKDFRGQGIGKLLMDSVISESMDNIPRLRLILLSVHAANSVAIEMYKDAGFVEYGKLPEGLFYKDNYVDELFMYKKVR